MRARFDNWGPSDIENRDLMLNVERTPCSITECKYSTAQVCADVDRTDSGGWQTKRRLRTLATRILGPQLLFVSARFQSALHWTDGAASLFSKTSVLPVLQLWSSQMPFPTT